MFSALAHPLRREIVERLSGGPATVGEVTRDFAVSKPTISRHLRMLEEAGVVSRVIVGRTHRCSAEAACQGRDEAVAIPADHHREAIRADDACSWGQRSCQERRTQGPVCLLLRDPLEKFHEVINEFVPRC